METMNVADSTILPVSGRHVLFYRRWLQKRWRRRVQNHRQGVMWSMFGHRIGTAEVENAINQHSNVVESAVVGYHDIRGPRYIRLRYHQFPLPMKNISAMKLMVVVTKEIGAIAKPDRLVVSGLPKTRSGKIMRRNIEENCLVVKAISPFGDVSTTPTRDRRWAQGGCDVCNLT